MIQNFGKIFVGGSVMSGKNILWRLLDGHSKIVVNIHHNYLGYGLLSDRCKEYFIRKIPGIGTSTNSHTPNLLMKYNDELVSIPIGDFFYAIYHFSNYGRFYSWVKGNSVFVNMKEGKNVRFPFLFNINGFEKTMEKELFSGTKVFNEQNLLDVIYSSYLSNVKNKYPLRFCKFFVDTLPNGIEPIKTMVNKLPDSKILIMSRTLSSLLYSNTVRIMSYQGNFQLNDAFKRQLFDQKIFELKIKKFHEETTEFEDLHDNVMLVDFNDMIINTKKTMKSIANFIGVNFEEILAVPSVNGDIIDNNEFPIIGKINDDPYESLSKNEIDLLNYLLYGYDKQYSTLRNASIFLQSIKWRQLPTLKRKVGVLLKAVIPTSIFVHLKRLIIK